MSSDHVDAKRGARARVKLLLFKSVLPQSRLCVGAVWVHVWVVCVCGGVLSSMGVLSVRFSRVDTCALTSDALLRCLHKHVHLCALRASA